MKFRFSAVAVGDSRFAGDRGAKRPLSLPPPRDGSRTSPRIRENSAFCIKAMRRGRRSSISKGPEAPGFCRSRR